MGARLLQPTMTAGELSPSLYARVDLNRYMSGLRRCRNFIVRPYGGAENRPGFRFIASMPSTVRHPMLPFVFSDSLAYVLVFGPGYIRFVINGAEVAPATTAWDAGTTFALDQYVEDAGGVYRSLQAGNVGNSPASSPAWWVADSGLQITSPWGADEIADLRYTQSADVMYLAHPSHYPRELRRLQPNAFELRKYVAVEGPFAGMNLDESLVVAASGVQGTVTVTSNKDIFTADAVGSLFRIETKDLGAVKPWVIGDRGVGVGTLRRNDGKTYMAVSVPSGGAWSETGSNPPVHEAGRAWDGPGTSRTDGVDTWYVGVQWEYVDSGYGIVEIQSLVGPREVTGTVRKRLPASVVGGVPTPDQSWPFAGDGTTKTFSPLTGVGYGVLTVTIDGVPLQSDPNYRPPGSAYEWKYGTPGMEELEPEDPAAQGWVVNRTAESITFNDAPAAGAAIVVAETSADGINATDYWAFGAWSDASGYPSEVEFYADRLVWARGQTLWFTRAGSYDNHGRSTPGVDTDAIVITINARQVNSIRELVPLSDLLIMTSSAEWRLTTGADGVVAPGKVGFKPQSYFGAAKLTAPVVGMTSLFVQGRGNVVRDLSFEFTQDGYTGNDLTTYADHLVEHHTLVDVAFQQAPYSCVWLVRDDGVLLSLTYVREQEVVGWAAHTTEGLVESVCTVPEGIENALYVGVRRTIEGVERFYVERLEERDMRDGRDAFFVDSGLTFDGRLVDGTAILLDGVAWDENEPLTIRTTAAVWSGSSDVGDQVRLRLTTTTRDGGEVVETVEEARFKIIAFVDSTHVTVQAQTPIPESLREVELADWEILRDTIAGLEHLEGEVVAVLADANVQERKTVIGGTITLDRPAAVVHVGLPYRSLIESLDVNIPGSETVRDKPKNIGRVALLVRNTRGLKSGTSEATLDEFKVREFEDYEDPTALVTGVLDVNCDSTWDRNGRFMVVQDDPLPATILGMIPEVAVSGGF